jgi:hypothetical protein
MAGRSKSAAISLCGRMNFFTTEDTEITEKIRKSDYHRDTEARNQIHRILKRPFATLTTEERD